MATYFGTARAYGVASRRARAIKGRVALKQTPKIKLLKLPKRDFPKLAIISPFSAHLVVSPTETIFLVLQKQLN